MPASIFAVRSGQFLFAGVVLITEYLIVTVLSATLFGACLEPATCEFFLPVIWVTLALF
jgi:hypothetical protein